ncbi:fam-a protein [Plasmodium chabaudi chabaudi]|uniref:Fam-a protein n=1 Tax=Plasmodium chabaudi chabaudi TaxID=31271 RepID=A0A1D3RUU5_PLACU|nr:fam-a protein [Plasmodium chabaudi chabaudi]
MNKAYIRLFFFVLSMLMYASTQTFANEASLVNDTINKPVQTKTNPGNKPVQTKATPANKPVQTKATPANKPVQKKTTPANKPVQKKTTPANKPVQAKAAASNNPAQANKKVKKSGLSRFARKLSSIFLSIFRACACGASKPKKAGQNIQVRGKNIPENTKTENTTAENTATENTTTEIATPENTTPENTTPENTTTESTTTESTTAESTTTENTTAENTATENTTTEIATPENTTIDVYTFDELYENNKHLLCNDPEEVEKVAKLMSESAAILQKKIESTDDFRNDVNHEGARLFRKQDETDTGKMEITIENPDAYDGIKTTLWNPNSPQNTDPSFLMGQVVRVYNPNLMMIQQCYTSGGHSAVKYFHYFAQKIEVSKDKTIMVYFSTNKTDINDSVERNMGILIDIAYSLKPDCDYEEEFKNNYVNLSGYFINKDDTKIDITYLDSIYNDYILAPLYGFKRVRSKKYTQLMNLKGKFSKKNRYIPNSTFLLD